jgi:hypothetical protein
VATPDAALQLLSLLQREARLIDFANENITVYSDADIGAAARVVHEGCARVLREHFTIEPVRGELEGARVTLQEGFDAASVRLTGNVVGKAPFTGTLSHRGWRASKVSLPQLADKHDASILAPAEVELCERKYGNERATPSASTSAPPTAPCPMSTCRPATARRPTRACCRSRS